MRSPELSGLIERRLLVNYRVDPAVVAGMLPSPFRPQVVGGWAVAGICLIRLGQLRPQHLPSRVGLRTENAAHRIAVEWDTPEGTKTGVYIPRRDTASLISVAVGGRLYPGEHNWARFAVEETSNRLQIKAESRDRTTAFAVHAKLTDQFGPSVLFADLQEASLFFEHGSVGYSARTGSTSFDGLALHTNAWQVHPAEALVARSSFFDDPARFPPGTATLDCALVMRDVPARWRPLPRLEPPAAAASWLSRSQARL